MADVDGESTAAAAAALVQMMEKVSAALQLSELFNERRRRPLHGIIHGSLLGLRLCLRYTYVYSSVQQVIVSGRVLLLILQQQLPFGFWPTMKRTSYNQSP